MELNTFAVLKSTLISTC